MSFNPIVFQKLNAQVETAYEAALTETSDDALDYFVKKFEAFEAKSKVMDVSEDEIKELFDEIESHGPKTAYYFALSAQMGFVVLEMIAGTHQADLLIAEMDRNYGTSGAKDFSAQLYILNRVTDTLGENATAFTKKLKAEFNKEIFKKGPSAEATKEAISIFKRALTNTL